ncbi:MAG: hypothetical protein K9N47_12940 [Prosthecobacter sp.]|uniref:hypothetical protein n=1 Tax=Prosthecobacter sp. TaxID=1965333 RepID=UPI0025CCD5D5|nr:hypothetical protein [Prosthecobacter sp.]MCF7787024.1 hypothetical protein [Prosthecobacter sp.]
MLTFDAPAKKPFQTFCYLIGVLKKQPSKSQMKAEFFTEQFEWLMNVEDQSDTVTKTKENCDLTNKYVLPTAPLTMTASWSPFPFAASVMPEILQHGKTDDPYSSSYAIFHPVLKIGESITMQFGGKPTTFELPVSGNQLEFENIHAHHFFWLLEMTIARAQQMKKPVILAGMHGFGYQDAIENDLIAESRLRLLEAGYLYPSRVPQGARFAFFKDPIARAARNAEVKRMPHNSPVFPPPGC